MAKISNPGKSHITISLFGLFLATIIFELALNQRLVLDSHFYKLD
jgi:hypothetical protein